MDTEMVLTFDRTVSGKLERIKGTISGGNFVISSGGRGEDSTTEQAHTSPTVEYIPNAADMNDMVTGILIEHGQTGVHDATKVAMLAGAQTVTGAKTFGSGLLKATKPVISGTNPTAATYTPATGSQTVALDCAANNMHFVTGHADGTAITFTIANATNNQPFIVSILQGGVVSTIAAWFATIRWAGGSAPTLTATINKRDTFGFIRTGTDTYDGFVIGQNA
jgi:hypothetical protein